MRHKTSYLADLKKSGVAAQLTESHQQKVFHCVFSQHSHQLTHDLQQNITVYQLRDQNQNCFSNLQNN